MDSTKRLLFCTSLFSHGAMKVVVCKAEKKKFTTKQKLYAKNRNILGQFLKNLFILYQQIQYLIVALYFF